VRARAYLFGRATAIVLVSALAASACATVLGIDDVTYTSEAAAPDAGQDGTTGRDGESLDGTADADAGVDAYVTPRCIGDAFVDATTGCQDVGVSAPYMKCETFSTGVSAGTVANGTMTQDFSIFVSPDASALVHLNAGAAQVWAADQKFSLTELDAATVVFGQATAELDVQFLGRESRVEFVRIGVDYGLRTHTFVLAIRANGSLELVGSLPDGGTQTFDIARPNVDVICLEAWTHIRIAVKFVDDDRVKVSVRFQENAVVQEDHFFPTTPGPKHEGSARLTFGLARDAGPTPYEARFDNVQLYIE
jgi:hypothetical protein